MSYKIVLKEGFNKTIEELRALHGDYYETVFFWDCMRTQIFISEEEAKEFIKYKVAVVDSKRILIKSEDNL